MTTYYAIGLETNPDGTNVIKKEGALLYVMRDGKWVEDGNLLRYWMGEGEIKEVTRAQALTIAKRAWKGYELDTFL